MGETDELVKILKALSLSGDEISVDSKLIYRNTESDPGTDSFKLAGQTAPFLGVNNINIVYYSSGHISYIKGDCGISFGFDGCLMARLPHEGRTCIAHVSTAGNSSQDCKLKLRDYLKHGNYQNAGIIMFRPELVYPDRNRSQNSVWGIITESGKCYSILTERIKGTGVKVNDIINNRYKIISVTEVNPPFTSAKLYIDTINYCFAKGDSYNDIWNEKCKTLQNNGMKDSCCFV